jgi:protein-S-isoprenylcysteine O-methyltransferase Ste14
MESGNSILEGRREIIVDDSMETEADMKGLDILAKHFPDLNSVNGRRNVTFYSFGMIALTVIYFVITDNIPTWSIDSQLIILALGYLMLSFFFSRKKQYQEKYGALAYRNAFMHFVIPGLGLIFGAVIHAGFMNGPFIPRGWWTTMFVVFGWLSLISGAILWVRAVFALGIDTLTMLYVYHPEESRLVESSIYNILRHPVYAGGLRVMIGLAFINCNANSIAFTIFLPLGLFGWIRLVEEKELIERFGQQYLDYRKRVPAFIPRLGDIGKYLNFLFTGK